MQLYMQNIRHRRARCIARIAVAEGAARFCLAPDLETSEVMNLHVVTFVDTCIHVIYMCSGIDEAVTET